MMLSVVILLLTVTYVECHVLFIVIQSVNMLSAIVLSVVFSKWHYAECRETLVAVE